MEKQELLEQLKKINELQDEAQKVDKEIKHTHVNKRYIRKIVVPDKPTEPVKIEKPIAYHESFDDYFRIGSDYFIRTPIFLTAVAIFIFLSSFFSDLQWWTNVLRKISISIIALAGIFVFIDLIKYLKRKSQYREYVSQCDYEFSLEKKKYEAYLQQYEKYAIELKNYEKMRKLAAKEEDEIYDCKRKDTEEMQKELRTAKYDPIIAKLNEQNNGLIADIYLKDINQIINILEQGRADSLKEALNVLEDIKFKEEQLNLERVRIQNEQMAREESKVGIEVQCNNCIYGTTCLNYGKFANCVRYRSRR